MNDQASVARGGIPAHVQAMAFTVIYAATSLWVTGLDVGSLGFMIVTFMITLPLIGLLWILFAIFWMKRPQRSRMAFAALGVLLPGAFVLLLKLALD